MNTSTQNKRNFGCIAALATIIAAVIGLTPFFYHTYHPPEPPQPVERIVILYSMKSKESAISKAIEIRKKGYPASVCISRNEYFAISIGVFEEKEARMWMTKMIRNGIGRRDTFLGDPKNFLKIFPKENYIKL